MAVKRNSLYFFYILTGVILLAMKYFYREAGSDDLDWILAPTARWAGILGGIPFTGKAGVGYVNHAVRFIIAPSCSGFQFMIITTATLIFSYLRRMRSVGGRLGWILLGLVLAYGYTVFVNGLRIVLSVYLPPLLRDSRFYRGWLTPERVHTMIGIGCFFSALLLIYYVVGKLLRMIRLGESKGGKLLPVFWYFLFSLGIPLIGRVYRNQWQDFAEYALLMVVIGGGLSLLFILMPVRNKLRKSINDEMMKCNEKH